MEYEGLFGRANLVSSATGGPISYKSSIVISFNSEQYILGTDNNNFEVVHCIINFQVEFKLTFRLGGSEPALLLRERCSSLIGPKFELQLGRLFAYRSRSIVTRTLPCGSGRYGP